MSAFYARVLVSIADSVFWLIIIGAVGITIWLLFRGIVGYLLEDIGEEDEEGRRWLKKEEGSSIVHTTPGLIRSFKSFVADVMSLKRRKGKRGTQ